MKNQILSRLPEDFPWKNDLLYFDSLDSTNTYLKDLARSGAAHGTAVIAGRQTAGRGRMGRSFESPEGGLYLSILLRPACPAEQLSHLTCGVAVAVCDAIEALAGLRPKVKWTNDLVWDGKKLAGILTELVTQGADTAAIVGIGINCSQTPADFPPQLQNMATSLFAVTGKSWDVNALAAQVLIQLAKLDNALLSSREEMLTRYRRDCITLGKTVSLICGDSVRHGKALDVLSDGSLLVELEDGTREAVCAGEVSIRGMYGYV